MLGQAVTSPKGERREIKALTMAGWTGPCDELEEMQRSDRIIFYGKI